LLADERAATLTAIVERELLAARDPPWAAK
jgi:hypothetical protein